MSHYNAEVGRAVDPTALTKARLALAAEEDAEKEGGPGAGLPVVLVGDALHGGAQGGAAWAICDAVCARVELSCCALPSLVLSCLRFQTLPCITPHPLLPLLPAAW